MLRIQQRTKQTKTPAFAKLTSHGPVCHCDCDCLWPGVPVPGGSVRWWIVLGNKLFINLMMTLLSFLLYTRRCYRRLIATVCVKDFFFFHFTICMLLRLFSSMVSGWWKHCRIQFCRKSLASFAQCCHTSNLKLATGISKCYKPGLALLSVVISTERDGGIDVKQVD